MLTAPRARTPTEGGHSEASEAKARNLSEERPDKMYPHCDPGCPFESAFADRRGKNVRRMCDHHAHNGWPHFDGPLPPSVPAGSRHASCGPANYRGLYAQPPLGNTRRKQACLSAGTGARSSRHRESSSATCAYPARVLGRGKLGLGTPYGIERLCGRSRKACSSLATGVAAELLKRQTKPTELALFSSVPSPSFPLGLRPGTALGGCHLDGLTPTAQGASSRVPQVLRCTVPHSGSHPRVWGFRQPP